MKLRLKCEINMKYEIKTELKNSNSSGCCTHTQQLVMYIVVSPIHMHYLMADARFESLVRAGGQQRV